MEHYIIQKAQQALKDLASSEPLIDRLKNARLHLSIVTSEHWLSSAPKHVSECLRELEGLPMDAPLPSQAEVICACIEYIFEESGRQDAVEQA